MIWMLIVLLATCTYADDRTPQPVAVHVYKSVGFPSPEYGTPVIPHLIYGPAGAPTNKGQSGEDQFPTSITDDGTSPTITLPKGTQLDIRNPDGQFSHGFSDKNGTTIIEHGKLITTNGGWEYVIAKTGSYSYISPEGIPIRVDYIADENGYRATGTHIPTKR